MLLETTNLLSRRQIKAFNRPWVFFIVFNCLVVEWIDFSANPVFKTPELYILTEFAKTWLKKFQVHFNNLTSKLNAKQWKVTSQGSTITALLLAADAKFLSQK